jgi:histidinol-phosphatase
MTTAAFDLDRIGGRAALRGLVDEVSRAGEEALRLYREGAAARFERKADASPVTEADRAVETRLRTYCAHHFPEVTFVGEESGESAHGASGMRFIVDPIDGTRPFLRGVPTWATLVGLEDEHGPAMGVALMPAAGDLFIGVRGDGAEGNGRPLRVSPVQRLDESLVSHGGLEQFHQTGRMDLLERLAAHTYTQRGFHDFDGYRHVLWGKADAMIDLGVSAWDICAAAVLVREAGGRLTSVEGTESIHEGSALATNGHLHDALQSILAG